jgi:hypothetical protein
LALLKKKTQKERNRVSEQAEGGGQRACREFKKAAECGAPTEGKREERERERRKKANDPEKTIGKGSGNPPDPEMAMIESSELASSRALLGFLVLSHSAVF